jgi:hypothetical protein
MKRKFLFFIVCFCPVILLGQHTTKEKYKTSSGIFIARIVKIDTILVISPDNLLLESMPADDFKFIRVKFSVIRRLKSTKINTSKFVLIKLISNDHSCPYNFLLYKKYKLYLRSVKFSSESVLKQYRRWHFELDCYNRPELLAK